MKAGRGFAASLVLWMGIASVAAEPESAGEKILGPWLAAQTQVTSWSAEVVQIRSLATLTRPLSTPGHVWYVAPDKFRWELGRPPRSVAIRDGETLWVLSPPLRRAEKYALGTLSAGPAREALALLDSGFPRDIEAFRRRFEVVQATETNAVWRIQLRPRNEASRKLVPELVLEIGAADRVLRATELRFTDGSRLRNEFTAPKTGELIESQLFNPGVDATWKITEPATP